MNARIDLAIIAGLTEEPDEAERPPRSPEKPNSILHQTADFLGALRSTRTRAGHHRPEATA